MAASPPEVVELLDSQLRLAWSLWTELGVAGLERLHRQTVIHPESLLAFSAPLLAEDRRLRDEVLTWILQNHRWIGQRQLLHVLSTGPIPVLAQLGNLTTTIASEGGPRWPGHGDGRALPFTRSPRELGLSLDRPSLSILRFRAVFGLGARAEILVVLSAGEGPPLTAGEIQQHVASTARNIRDALHDLVAAGVVTDSGNPRNSRFRAVDVDGLRSWLGPLGQVVRWKTVLPLLGSATRVLLAPAGDELVRASDVRHELRRTESAWKLTGERPPLPREGEDYVRAVAIWLRSLTDRMLSREVESGGQ